MGKFVQIPNETLRDSKLSYLARGLLAEALTHAESWRHEGADETHRRARQARGDSAEGRRQIQAAYAELDRYGYRHRLRWQDRPGGKLLNAVKVYAVPTRCGDTRCVTCKPDDLGERDVFPGRPRYTGIGTSGVTRQNREFSQVGPDIPLSGGSETGTSTEHHGSEHHAEEENTASRDHAERAPAIAPEFQDEVIDELIDELGADEKTARTIDGMIRSGSHPEAVRNKIAPGRGRKGRPDWRDDPWLPEPDDDDDPPPF